MSSTKLKYFWSLFIVFVLILKTTGLALAANTNTAGIILKIKDSQFQLTPSYISKIFFTQNNLVYNPNYHSEIENIDTCKYSDSTICDLLSSSADSGHIQKTSSLSVDEKLLSDLVSDVSKQFDKDPENAKFQTENGKVTAFAAGSDGIKIDQEKSIQVITNYFKNNLATGQIDLPYNTTSPEISSDSVNNLGINSLIGEGHSNFAGSPKNRIFNIKVAIKKFDGVLIKPNEEFSFVKTLGEVDGDHGYLPELVIKQNKTELDFGGGICQVSTTTFRAAVYSGLKITVRRNHAYPVSYYNPQGFDSTVYVPSPDLKFINNTPGNILIQVKMVGTELIFQFYGTDDGRKTTVTGPTIIEKNPDGSMKTTLSQKVLSSTGETILNDTFNSNYESPSKFPHPGQVITEKPTDWSNKQWSAYKKEHNI